ncbi:MAG TPA: 3-dehydroquinate synthase [Candidatus Krumholzibacteriaceae bacterium]|nr:3-dehydroquinate synthase [Candidatus Krumholzibacteriaceae bacterium]
MSLTEYVAAEVRLGDRGYKIYVGAGLSGRLGEIVAASKPEATGCVMVTSEPIERLYGESVAASLRSLNPRTFVVPDGEEAKEWENAGTLLGRFLEAGLDRSSVVIALGGGAVGDLAGFAASIYMRGVAVVQVPTTLLGMVDSGIGGKTAVNHVKGKNMIGSFHQPVAVVADPLLLRSLPIREVVSGLAEAVKYGVIADEALFRYVEENMRPLLGLDQECMSRVIGRCASIKTRYVEEDERDDRGVRAALNYGHTLGHAAERLASPGLRHGEAVSIGMVYAAELAVGMGLMEPEEAQAQRRVLEGIGLPTKLPAALEADELIRYMRRDKKAEGGRIRMILPMGIGSPPTLRMVEESKLIEAMKAVT